MPNWKKVIISGSNAELNSLNVTAEVSASYLYAHNEPWTVELIDALSVDFYAPYSLAITTVTNISGSPTIQLKDDNSTYTLGNTIAIGSKITVNSDIASVVTLNIAR